MAEPAIPAHSPPRRDALGRVLPPSTPPRGRPWTQGHRGWPRRYPENSIAGFRAVLEAGADGIELDIQKSSDGVLLVSHDPTLDRCFGIPGHIGHLSAAEVQRLTGPEAPLPRLEEVLAACLPWEGRTINVEVKGDTLGPGDAALIHEALAPWRPHFFFIISAFGHPVLAPLKRQGWAVAMLVGEEHRSGGIGALLGTLVRLRPFSIHLPLEIFQAVPPKTLRFLWPVLRVLGVRVLFWTIQDPEETLGLPPSTWGLIADDAPGLGKR